MSIEISQADDEARELALQLLDGATFAALAVLDPATGAPVVTRVTLGTSPQGGPVTLVSDLSVHTRSLRADPRCSLLVGEPGPRGDPLTHPRLTLQCHAQFVDRNENGHDALRAHYLQDHPKAKLYVDFADFRFVRFEVTGAFLNGGFGKAFRLEPETFGPR